MAKLRLDFHDGQGLIQLKPWEVDSTRFKEAKDFMKINLVEYKNNFIIMFKIFWDDQGWHEKSSPVETNRFYPV